MQAFTAQTRAELSMSLRQGEQMLVSLGIPVLILVFFSLVDVLPKVDALSGVAGATAVDSVTPSVLALAIMSTAMVSLGIGTGFERYYKVLKRLGSTPLGRPRLVGAKMTMVLALELVQLVVIVPIAFVLGWSPGGPVWLVLPAYVLGTAAFAGLGLLMAGTLSGPLNLAACNGLYLILLLFGGIIIPTDRLPGPLSPLAGLLPSGALSNVMHASLTSGAAAPTGSWLVLAVWAIVTPILAARLFRWE
jgi:ABC-2 type transport system permease protein